MHQPIEACRAFDGVPSVSIVLDDALTKRIDVVIVELCADLVIAYLESQLRSPLTPRSKGHIKQRVVFES